MEEELATAEYTGAKALRQLEDAGLQQLGLHHDLDTPTPLHPVADDANERNISSAESLDIVIRTRAKAPEASSADAQTQLPRISDRILPTVEPRP